MSKRSTKVERPRSARLRRKPSDPILETNENNPNKGRTSEANKNNSRLLRIIIPDSGKHLGTKNNSIHGTQSPANPKLSIPHGIDRFDTNTSFKKTSEYSREPPKSPRILPKLDKSPCKPLSSSGEENFNNSANSTENLRKTMLKTNPVALSPFSQEEREGTCAFQLGKHYSVLPDISDSKGRE